MSNQNPISFTPLVPFFHDHIGLSYDSDGNISTVEYRHGGETGEVVCTLTLTYSNGNLTKVARS